MYKYSPHIIDNIDYLNRLVKTKSDRKKHTLILNATSEQILSIVEICANVLRSNFTLTNRQRQRLAKYADYYRAIARSRSEKTARNRIQQGGQLAIAALLAPVLSVIAQHLLDRALEK
jgi:hypothetical protein